MLALAQHNFEVSYTLFPPITAGVQHLRVFTRLTCLFLRRKAAPGDLSNVLPPIGAGRVGGGPPLMKGKEMRRFYFLRLLPQK